MSQGKRGLFWRRRMYRQGMRARKAAMVDTTIPSLPSISFIDDTSAPAYDDFYLGVTAFVEGVAAPSLEMLNAPSGLTVGVDQTTETSLTASISGTIAIGELGDYTVTLNLKDGAETVASQQFVLTVTNQPSTLAALTPSTVDIDDTDSIAISAEDVNADTMTVELYDVTGGTEVAAPSWATLNMSAQSTTTRVGSIDLDPTTGDDGVYTLRVVVLVGGVRQATRDVSVTVNATATPQAPILTPLTNQTMGELGTKVVTLIGTDPDGDDGSFAVEVDGVDSGSLSWVSVSQGSFDGSNTRTGSVTFTPDIDEADNTPHSVRVIYTANGLSDEQTITLTVEQAETNNIVVGDLASGTDAIRIRWKYDATGDVKNTWDSGDAGLPYDEISVTALAPFETGTPGVYEFSIQNDGLTPNLLAVAEAQNGWYDLSVSAVNSEGGDSASNGVYKPLGNEYLRFTPSGPTVWAPVLGETDVWAVLAVNLPETDQGALSFTQVADAAARGGQVMETDAGADTAFEAGGYLSLWFNNGSVQNLEISMNILDNGGDDFWVDVPGESMQGNGFNAGDPASYTNVRKVGVTIENCSVGTHELRIYRDHGGARLAAVGIAPTAYGVIDLVNITLSEPV